MEFKKGKEVRIVENTNRHDYEIGSIVTMDYQLKDKCFKAKEVVNGAAWVVKLSDCEEIEEKVMEFEEGKEVRIISNNNSHKYKIGSIVTMSNGYSDNAFYAKELVDGRFYTVRFSDCEEIEEKVVQFKKGKKVRVIANNNGHKYKIGSIVTIDNQCSDKSFIAKEIVNGDSWWVRYSDCEEIEKKPFGKQGLKTGMLVQFRNGDVFMVINDILVSDGDWVSLGCFNEDLNSNSFNYFDIMKVSKVLNGYLLMPKNWNKERLNKNLLWEREETKKMTISEMKKKLEEKLGHKIEIIE